MPIVITVVFTVLFFSIIKTVPGKEEHIVERAGRYHRTLYSGNHVILPLFERIVKKVPKNIMLIDFPPQFVVTKDKSEAKISFIVYFQIVDSLKYTYGAKDSVRTAKDLYITAFKDVIVEKKLDEITGTGTNIIENLKTEFNIKADFLGIEVSKIVLKQIDILYKSANLR